MDYTKKQQVYTKLSRQEKLHILNILLWAMALAVGMWVAIVMLMIFGSHVAGL